MDAIIPFDSAMAEEQKNAGEKAIAWAKSVQITCAEEYTAVSDGTLMIKKRFKDVTAWIKSITQPLKDSVKNTEATLKPLVAPLEEADQILTVKMNEWILSERKREQAAAEAERKEREAAEARGKDRMNQLLNMGFKWNKEQERFEDTGATCYLAELKNDPDPIWAKKVEDFCGMFIVPKEALDKMPAPVQADEMLPDVSEPKPVQTASFSEKSALGTTYTVKRWTAEFETADLAKLPREYLKIDEVKVNEAIRAGVREIPGLVIKEVEDVRRRTS
jgi:hypothetical protein